MQERTEVADNDIMNQVRQTFDQLYLIPQVCSHAKMKLKEKLQFFTRIKTSIHPLSSAYPGEKNKDISD